METKIENRLSMYRTVINFCDKSENVLQNVSGLWANYQLFKTAVDELDRMIQLQIRNLGGITADKTEAREKLAEMLQIVTAMVKAYAMEISDNQLYVSIHYSPSSLRYMRDENLLETATIIKTVTETHASHLSPFGYTTAIWNDYMAAFNRYTEMVEAPGGARKSRAVYTRAIKDIDKRIREILSRRLDNSIKVIGISDPILLKKYIASRNIYDNHGGRKKKAPAPGDIPAIISGTVTDDQGLPIVDALVAIEGTKISMTTDADGEYLIDTLHAGTYNIIITAEGYTETRENNLSLAASDDIVKDFTLDPL